MNYNPYLIITVFVRWKSPLPPLYQGGKIHFLPSKVRKGRQELEWFSRGGFLKQESCAFLFLAILQLFCILFFFMKRSIFIDTALSLFFVFEFICTKSYIAIFLFLNAWQIASEWKGVRMMGIRLVTETESSMSITYWILSWILYIICGVFIYSFFNKTKYKLLLKLIPMILLIIPTYQMINEFLKWFL